LGHHPSSSDGSNGMRAPACAGNEKGPRQGALGCFDVRRAAPGGAVDSALLGFIQQPPLGGFGACSNPSTKPRRRFKRRDS
jgi:hypothetical protein